ncbi:hypothetical protein [Melioribacter sp. OK-6-Me]|uniref:hypothetical protein n=1 Tax=unclassified Melioribacter TaxID=2627329 RepID=UPI003EDAE998
MKDNITDIIRKIISEDYNHTDIIELDNQINNMLHKWIKDTNKFIEAELIQDFKQNVMQSLWESFSKNEIWKEKIVPSEDNDKIMISYVYSIIRTCYRESIDKSSFKDVINLRSSVIKALETLVEKKLIIKENKFNEFYYSVNNKKEKKIYDGEVEFNRLFIVRQNSSNGLGKISSQAVYEAVWEILKNLENYYLSLSLIIEIIKNNSDVNSFKLLPLENTTDNMDENMNVLAEDRLIVENDAISITTDANKFIDYCNAKLNYYLSNKQKADYYKICFYLYFKSGFTYSEIRDFLELKFNKNISIQTVKNYISDFFNILDFKKDYNIDDKELMELIDAYMSHIANEFNLIEE